MSKSFSLIITVVFLSACFLAQNRVQDMGMWLSFKASYRIGKKQELNLMARVRQYENFTQIDSWYIDLGYALGISQGLKISAHYAMNPSVTIQNYFRNIHQYYLRIAYRKFINKFFTFYNRVIIQHATHRFITDFTDNGYTPYYRTNFRERIGFTYDLSSKDNFFLHNEWMITLSDTPIELRRNRVYAGYEKKYSDKWSVRYFFVLQSSFHRRNSPNRDFFIFGLDIALKLN